MPLGTEVDLSSDDIVLDDDPNPPRKEAQHTPPNFGHVLWPNCCTDQDDTWYGGRSRPGPNCVRWGPTAQRGTSLIFGQCPCGQTNGWITVPLGRDVDVSTGDIVLDWNPALPQRGTAAPSFRPLSIVAKRSPISAKCLFKTSTQRSKNSSRSN